MFRGCDFQWEAERGITVNGISRAPVAYLCEWCRGEPSQSDLTQHSTNPGGVEPGIWWDAQLKLYGFDYRGCRSVTNTINLVRSRILYPASRPANIPIGKKLKAYERALRRERNEPVVAGRPQPGDENEAVLYGQNIASNASSKRKADREIERPSKRVAGDCDGIQRTVHEPSRSLSILPEQIRVNESSGSESIFYEETPDPQAAATDDIGSDSACLVRPITVHQEQVKFIRALEHGWIVEFQNESIRYAIKERGFYDGHYFRLIDDCSYKKSSWVEKPWPRSARWRDDDHPLAFYNAQLMFRGLPTTRSKEVAKWRLRTALGDRRRPPLPDWLQHIFDQLVKIFEDNLFQLSRGAMDCDPRVGYNNINELPKALETTIRENRVTTQRSHKDYSIRIGDVQPWAVEQPASKLCGKSSYDVVMERWLAIRSQLPRPASEQSKQPRIIFETCRVCQKKLRKCSCESCEHCGELSRDCKCPICGICGLGVEEPCRCQECDKCWLKFDRENPDISSACFCFCDQCNQSAKIGKHRACACKLSSKDIINQRATLDERRVQHINALSDEHIEAELKRKMTFWAQSKHPDYWQRGPAELYTRYTHLGLRDICGSYELVVPDGMECTEKSEIVLSNDGQALYGRFRIGLNVHGLIRTNRVPDQASTEVVQCHTIVENHSLKNGTWSFGAKDIDEEHQNNDVGGITFLGNGLIDLSPSLFSCGGMKRGHGDAIFGVKVSEYKEDAGALKESWDALHKEYCDCAGDQSKHDWHLWDAVAVPKWNAYELDQRVNNLSRYLGAFRTVEKM